MTFDEMLARFRGAAVAGDGRALAALFTDDGVYHDAFYGAFEGRAAIAEMLEEHFHGAARDLVWEMDKAVCDGQTGYASYRFSFASTLPEAEDRRIMFKGMSRFELGDDGLIQVYDEVFDRGTALVQLGFAPERIAKSLTRWADQTRAEAGPAHKVAG